MKSLILTTALLLAFPVTTFACGDDGSEKLGSMSSYSKPDSNYGFSVTESGDVVSIDTTFVDGLLTKPSGALFDENRFELYYLVAREHKKAMLAGLKTLVHILNYPEYVAECDQQVELYQKEEIAHTLSRADSFHTEICELTGEERSVLFAYYKENDHLYQLMFDAPWEYDACPDSEKTTSSDEKQRPDFDAMKDWGGGLILEQAQEQYGFHIYSDEQNMYMVLQFSPERINGKAVWEYRYHIVLPSYEKTHQLIHGLCQKGGEFDGRIAAVVTYQDEELMGDALYAWSADIETNKINRISTIGITCSNESYGL